MNKFEGYLHDLGLEIKEISLEAKRNRDHAKSSEEKLYTDGYVMAFHRIISLMQQQAIGFGIDNKQLGLDDIDPDEDLI